MTYENIIEKFFYAEAPNRNVSKSVQFEAISDAIIGTKQLRYGPRPSPEDQVEIRKVIQHALDKEVPLVIFLPWACRKQDSSDLDVLEFMAIKQLRNLQETLSSFDLQVTYQFRVEDASDSVLFDDYDHERSMISSQTARYRETFRQLVSCLLRASIVRTELQKTTLKTFVEAVEDNKPLVRDMLSGVSTRQDLIAFAPEQKQYFDDLYEKLYPSESSSERRERLVTYFSCVFARRQLNAVCRPDYPHLFATFSHPVPGDPVRDSRLYYRTMPERVTNTHRAPWLSRGYFLIDDRENTATPRFRDELQHDTELHRGAITYQNIEFCADYLIKD
jgi:hypothetical protein